MSIGFDPKLFTSTQIKRFFFKNNKVKSIESNLIDQIHKNKVKSSSVSVTRIIEDVKKNGDKALFLFTKKFDGMLINSKNLRLNKFIIENENFKVNIILVINSSNERFMKEININDTYWSSNKKYFQDNFVLFVKTLNDTLIKKSGNLTFKIERLDNDNINIKLKHSSSFLSFTTEFILVKILTENEKISLDIDKLIKENNKLKFELQNLKREIINIKSNYNRINESYILIELKNVLIGNTRIDNRFYYEKHYKPSNENYSGEIILLNHNDEIKNRMNTNSYVACMRFDNGKTFYFKYPWRQILLNLNPILPDYYFKQYNIEAKQRLETTYIRIPKDDIKNRNLPNQTTGLVITKIANNSPVANSIELTDQIEEKLADKETAKEMLSLLKNPRFASMMKTEDSLNSAGTYKPSDLKPSTTANSAVPHADKPATEIPSQAPGIPAAS